MIANLAARMRDMHEAGYAHRDLKPANVMWLPRENRWTVIDFGCAARIGSLAPLAFTLIYAPPEVVRASEAQQESFEVAASVDAWALGVMAFELLIGAPAFRIVTDGIVHVRPSAVLPALPCILFKHHMRTCIRMYASRMHGINIDRRGLCVLPGQLSTWMRIRHAHLFITCRRWQRYWVWRSCRGRVRGPRGCAASLACCGLRCSPCCTATPPCGPPWSASTPLSWSSADAAAF